MSKVFPLLWGKGPGFPLAPVQATGKRKKWKASKLNRKKLPVFKDDMFIWIYIDIYILDTKALIYKI
jgi:hypothetical protein